VPSPHLRLLQERIHINLPLDVTVNTSLPPCPTGEVYRRFSNRERAVPRSEVYKSWVTRGPRSMVGGWDPLDDPHASSPSRSVEPQEYSNIHPPRPAHIRQEAHTGRPHQQERRGQRTARGRGRAQTRRQPSLSLTRVSECQGIPGMSEKVAVRPQLQRRRINQDLTASDRKQTTSRPRVRVKGEGQVSYLGRCLSIGPLHVFVHYRVVGLRRCVPHEHHSRNTRRLARWSPDGPRDSRLGGLW
jgi:hypothetical protein